MTAGEARSPGDRDALKLVRRQRRLALCLLVIAGYVDAYGLFALGAYVSVMSGNTTTIGLRLGERNLVAASPPALAIAGFLVGSFLGNLVTYARTARAAHRRLFGLVALLLVLAAPLGAQPATLLLCIPTLSLAMGMFNVALARVGAEPISVTFVTGTLARVGQHLALGLRRAPLEGAEGAWDSHLSRALVGLQLWGAFLLGSCLCGLVTSLDRRLVLVPALVVVLGLAAAGPS